MAILRGGTKVLKSNRMFVKLLSFFVLLLVLSVFLVGYTSYLNSSKFLVDEVKNHNLLELRQVRDNIDQKIVLLDNTTLQIAIDKRVKKAFYMTDGISPSNVLLSTEIITYLSSIKSSSGFIDSIALYFNKPDLIITNDGKYDLNTFIKDIYKDYQMSKEMWMDIFNEYSFFRVVKEYDIVDRTVQNRTIAFVRSLPIETRDPCCTVFIHVDRKEFRNIIGNTENRNNVSMFIIDSEGNIITGNDITERNREINHRVIKSILENQAHGTDGQEKFNDLNIQGDLYSVASIKSQKNDWQYVSVIPTHFIAEKTDIIKKVTLLTISVSLLIGILLSCMLTQNIYRPIHKIVHYIEMMVGCKASLNSEKGRGEINFINKFIDLVYHENKSLTDAINKNIPMLREKLLSDLLDGRTQYKELPELLSSVNLCIPFNAFQVIIFEIDDFADSIEQLLARENRRVSGMVEAFAAKNPFYPVIRVYSLEKRNGKTVCLVNMNADYEKPEIIYDLINQITEFYFREDGLSFSVGIGKVYRRLEDIPSSYIESLYALKCKITEGQNRIIHYDEVSNLSHNPYVYPIESEKQIVNLMKSGDFDGIKGILQEILSRNTESKEISPEMIENLFAALAGTAIRTIYDVNSSVEEIFGKGYNIYARLCQNDTIHQKEQYILDTFRRITEYINMRRKSKNDILYKKVTDYIAENYSKDLSLDIVGSITGLSPSYLSWLFKEISGKNFVDYLNSYRIEQAKILLKKSNYSVNEIGEKVGFTNSNTFIRVFKKYEGITPGSFKALADQ